MGPAGWTLDAWRRLLAEPGVGHSAALALGSGAGATLLALASALLIAASLHHRLLARRLRVALGPLLAVPHLAAATALAFLIAPSGLLVRVAAPFLDLDRPPDLATVQDPWALALMLGLWLRETPFLLLVIVAAAERPGLGRRIAVARTLGRGAAQAWLAVALPAIWPALRLPTAAVLAFAVSTVDMALVLGPQAPPPLAVLVVQWLSDPDLGRRPLACAGALLLGLVALGTVALLLLLEAAIGRLVRATQRRAPPERLLTPAGLVLAALVVGSAVLGLGVLAGWSLARRWRFPALLPDAPGLSAWATVLPSLGPALATTLSLALATACLALVLAVATFERAPSAPWVMRLAWIPLLVPQPTFLAGLVVLAIHLDADGTWWIVAWAHLLFVLPYTLLLLEGPWRSFDRRWVEVGRTLGRGAPTVLARVTLPLLRAPLAAALAIGISVSVAQYLATLLPGGGRVRTLATETMALALSGDRRLTAVAALVLMIVPLVPLALALTVARGRIGRAG